MSDAPPPAPAPSYSPAAASDKWNVLAIVGFVGTFIIPLAGLIISAIALNQIKTTGERGRGLALAGLILSIIYFVILIIVIIAAVVVGASSPSYSG
ncbi:DUF4190 domain-containing protein [Pseudolysinimonas sp.]|uniref:DUF4190 domain-containing protein n=1 Tax=Pseudolysinimonas sp. TaxID=2680009 RepID=UPI003F7E786F